MILQVARSHMNNFILRVNKYNIRILRVKVHVNMNHCIDRASYFSVSSMSILIQNVIVLVVVKMRVVWIVILSTVPALSIPLSCTARPILQYCLILSRITKMTSAPLQRRGRQSWKLALLQPTELSRRRRTELSRSNPRWRVKRCTLRGRTQWPTSALRRTPSSLPSLHSPEPTAGGATNSIILVVRTYFGDKSMLY